MTRPKDAKVWNEDLVLALQAREQMARRAEKRSHLLWREGWHAIQAVRGDIYAFKNGRIVHLPDKLKTTVANLCRNIIAGTEPVFPPEYVPYDPHQQQQQHGGSRGGGGNGENPYLKDPYLNSIKKRGGAFAILMAFHTSPYDQVLTKDQICAAAQPFCDTEMTENYMAGRARGAWSGIKTLQAHDLVMVQQRAIGYNDRAGGLRSLGKNSYMLTPNGRLFITALLQKNPDLQREQRSGSVGRASTHPNHNHDIVGIHSFQDHHHHHHHDDASIHSATGITDLWQDPFSSRNSVPHGFPMKSSPPRTYSTLSGSTGGGHVLNQSPTAKRRLNFVSSRDAAANAAFERQAIEESIRMAEGMSNTKSSARPKEGTNRIPPSKKLVPQPSSPIMIDLTQQQNYPYDGMVEEAERKLPAVMVVNPYLSARMKSSSRAVVVPVVLDLDSDDSDDDDVDDILNYRSSTLASSSTATMKRPSSSTVPRSSNVQRNNYPARQLPVVAIEEDDDAILDLTDSQPTPVLDDNSEYHDEHIITPSEDGKPAAAAALKSQMVEPSSNNRNRRKDTTTSNNLAIYIDDRERNRNRTPRTLRMELSRLLSTTTGIGGGIFSLVWPHKVPPPIVEERRLPIGDFAFHRIVSSSTSTEQNTTIALPISLERKRIGDLVGRSAHKDHWYQWQRMQDEAIHRGDGNGICIMLLEGDPRTTVQFVPYGAQQEAETFSPFVHTIDDEETFYRYMCRTIINGTLMCVCVCS
jgi:hypothetical protein